MIIGLTGYAGSGKDTLAEILVREHGFVRYAFADKLRELAYSLDPTIIAEGVPVGLQDLVDECGWDSAKRRYLQVRSFLQDLGVWHRDNVSEDFWVDLLHEHMDQGADSIVITDVRFPNEAKWVRNFWDGQVWRVQRPGVGPVNAHISEQLDLAADATIWNGGSKAALMLKVNELLTEERAA